MYNSKNTLGRKAEEKIEEARKKRKAEEEKKSYKIIRMFFEDNLKNEVITKNLTLEEAKKHCRREDTSGIESGRKEKGTDQWFDGFEED